MPEIIEDTNVEIMDMEVEEEVYLAERVHEEGPNEKRAMWPPNGLEASTYPEEIYFEDKRSRKEEGQHVVVLGRGSSRIETSMGEVHKEGYLTCGRNCQVSRRGSCAEVKGRKDEATTKFGISVATSQRDEGEHRIWRIGGDGGSVTIHESCGLGGAGGWGGEVG
mgnify:FL=1